MMLITTLVVSFLVCCMLEVRCGLARVVSGLQAKARLSSYMSVYFGFVFEVLNADLAKITVYHEDLMTPPPSKKKGTKIQTSSMLKYVVHTGKVGVYRTGTDIVLLLATNENLETYRKLTKFLLC